MPSKSWPSGHKRLSTSTHWVDSGRLHCCLRILGISGFFIMLPNTQYCCRKVIKGIFRLYSLLPKIYGKKEKEFWVISIDVCINIWVRCNVHPIWEFQPQILGGFAPLDRPSGDPTFIISIDDHSGERRNIRKGWWWWEKSELTSIWGQLVVFSTTRCKERLNKKIEYSRWLENDFFDQVEWLTDNIKCFFTPQWHEECKKGGKAVVEHPSKPIQGARLF